MNSRTKKIGATLLTTAAALIGVPQVPAHSNAVRACQVGYLPDETKFGMLTEQASGPVTVRRVKDGKAVLTVNPGVATEDEDSGDIVRRVDFSALKTPGEYVLDAPGLGSSYPFKIGKDVFAKPFRLAMRAFTGQRASTNVSLAPDFPQFKYEAGHTAPAQYDPSSGKTGTRDVSGGWYDAGDYGRYIVNSGITTGTLLWSYELYGSKLRKVNLNIPESGGKIPDVLDEIKWNLDWMLKMQDEDGGVWHKATTANFPGYIMPKDDKGTVLVIGTGRAPFKNTTATADFAAVAAIAARIYRPFDRAYADRCLDAARSAWEWAEKNPNVLFRNNPQGISTGGYGDSDASDERLWASAELFRTTGEKAYHDAFLAAAPKFHLKGDAAQGWPSVGNMGLYTYVLANRKNADTPTVTRIKSEARQAADEIVKRVGENGYRNPLLPRDYVWGSNAVVGNYGMMLLLAHKIQPNPTYRNTALDSLHYLLGRNTFNTSYVSWVGTKWAMKPHHRPSAADGIDQPWPGLLMGGPNAEGKRPPAKQWEDNQDNYRMNEIAINWNAPLVFVLAGAL
ncbi:glycosyl hydrolase family 5 [bacterium]|nr:MAG: glycosyl hydrolase family 5 [bacterium]